MFDLHSINQKPKSKLTRGKKQAKQWQLGNKKYKAQFRLLTIKENNPAVIAKKFPMNNNKVAAAGGSSAPKTSSSLSGATAGDYSSDRVKLSFATTSNNNNETNTQ